MFFVRLLLNIVNDIFNVKVYSNELHHFMLNIEYDYIYMNLYYVLYLN